MKLIEGTIYFPKLFSESQCSDCGKILQWFETIPKSEFESKCCNKVFKARVNYVNIKIEEVNKLESNEKIEQIKNVD